MKIHKNGFWENSDSLGHRYDPVLSEAIASLLKEKSLTSVVDFGCGMGLYAKKIIDSGIYCEAYDGNPNTPFLTKGIGKVLDFTNKFELENKFDCVLSLEVGEHIPKEYEEIFLNNIVIHSKKIIILSWAVVGQKGDGHVNCKNNEEVINDLSKNKFNYNSILSNFLRKNVTNAPWFRNTIMVFEKNEI